VYDEALSDRALAPDRDETWRLAPFLIHLRLHYQFGILTAPFLCGALFAGSMSWGRFALQLVNVHALLFGGATAYNSYWDRDEGPIGGLRQPPRMQAWMHPAALGLQIVGFILALDAGPAFATCYAVAAALFWLYSTPHARWKGRPLLSFVAIGGSTGLASLLMGRLAADPAPLHAPEWLAALAVSMVLASLYPVSQVYQLDQDRSRGDRTFALVYGMTGVRRAFRILYGAGGALLALALAWHGSVYLAGVFALSAAVIGVAIWRVLARLAGEPGEYDTVMRIKYATSVGFVVFLIAAIALVHGGVAP
jgi:hypothetical protein